MADQPTDGRAALRRALGAEPAALRRLADAECAELAGLVDRVRVEQKAELDRALDDVLGALPRLVRRPARKIMFG